MRERGPSGPDPCPDLSRCCVCAVCVWRGGQKGRVGCRGREGERERRVFLCFFLFPSPFFPSFFQRSQHSHKHTTHNAPPPSLLKPHTRPLPSHTHTSPPKTQPPRESAPLFPSPSCTETDRDRQRQSVWRGRDGLVSPSPFSSLFHGGQRKEPTHTPQGATRQRR